MSSNRILAFKNVGSVFKHGQEIIVGAATITERYSRTELVAERIGLEFIKLADKSKKPLPSGTTKLIVRETEHQSPGDMRSHWTVVAYNQETAKSTLHFKADGGGDVEESKE